MLLHTIPLAGALHAQHSVVFYNVENLFDYHDDPSSGDEDFTADGEMQWDQWKYYRKLKQVFQVIAGAGGWESPALVGLCEVENRKVLEDLLTSTHLGKVPYRILHRDSRDHRGIDVALLVRTDLFQVVELDHYPVVREGMDTLLTRDILEATLLYGTDTISVFVNHWPSRSGGVYETLPLRISAARALTQRIKSLPAERAVLAMGDFNCSPEADPLLLLMGACRQAPSGPLYLLKPAFPDGCRGTYSYKGVWETIDHMLADKRFLEDFCGGLSAADDCLAVYAEDWMLEKDASGNARPHRTFKGPFFAGGTSDHLPLVLKITLR